MDSACHRIPTVNIHSIVPLVVRRRIVIAGILCLHVRKTSTGCGLNLSHRGGKQVKSDGGWVDQISFPGEQDQLTEPSLNQHVEKFRREYAANSTRFYDGDVICYIRILNVRGDTEEVGNRWLGFEKVYRGIACDS